MKVFWELSVDPDWGTRGPRPSIFKFYFYRTRPQEKLNPMEILQGLAKDDPQAARALAVCSNFAKDKNGYPRCLMLNKLEVVEI